MLDVLKNITVEYLCNCGEENEFNYSWQKDVNQFTQTETEETVYICPGCESEHHTTFSYEPLGLGHITYKVEGCVPKTDPFYEFFRSYYQLHRELEEIKESVDEFSKFNNSIMRLLFTHSITVFEAFLSDTLKFFVWNNTEYFANFVESSHQLKKEKFTLSEILLDSDLARKKVLEQLNSILFHKLSVVISIYKSTLNIDLRDLLNEDKRNALMSFVEVRHDCVHRNGRDSVGNKIQLTQSDVFEVLGIVEETIEFVFEKSIELEVETGVKSFVQKIN